MAKKFFASHLKQVDDGVSLLDKARSIQHNKRSPDVSRQEIELAIAWLKDEITITQAARACAKPQNVMQSRMAMILREAFKLNILTIKENS